MATLLLRLAAPLQAWGSGSKFNIRNTEREPTKSGVVGMIAAAMGIQRNDDQKLLEPICSLKFGVRVDREGTLLKDFHMVHEYKNGKVKDSHLTERYYLSDAVFLAAFESDSREYLESIVKALNNPVYPLFLGRRSCPPTLPVVIGISDEPLIESLRTAEPLTKNYKSRRIVYEADSGTVVQDVPVSFSQLHRIHEYRFKKEEMLTAEEHDPMAEL
ncbi:type I-E CRISPR-associated protein Cas5/CasD [uncultured Ruminococcus sp.]|uniref:type I-E CRISPR-associated protein Cas5/CasD n=1 Tax=uncultured Ruminococcus sp. TaxID=165186 RepID=UPI0025F75709|nr:type I-E CRISPR-associated protein Cas5/CasD [uncultured Ruminococcus sp.]